MEDSTSQENHLKKLYTIATDTSLPSELRLKTIEQIGRVGTHAALLVLLDLVANDRLIRKEREAALKKASEIVKSGQ